MDKSLSQFKFVEIYVDGQRQESTDDYHPSCHHAPMQFQRANLLRIDPRNIRGQAPAPIQTSKKSQPPASKSKSIPRNQAPSLPVLHQALHHVVQQPLPRCCSRASALHRLPCLTHHPATLARALQQNHTYLLHHDRPQCRGLDRSCVQPFRPPRRKLRGVLCSVCLLPSQLPTTGRKQRTIRSH